MSYHPHYPCHHPSPLSPQVILDHPGLLSARIPLGQFSKKHLILLVIFHSGTLLLQLLSYKSLLFLVLFRVEPNLSSLRQNAIAVYPWTKASLPSLTSIRFFFSLTYLRVNVSFCPLGGKVAILHTQCLGSGACVSLHYFPARDWSGFYLITIPSITSKDRIGSALQPKKLGFTSLIVLQANHKQNRYRHLVKNVPCGHKMQY